MKIIDNVINSKLEEAMETGMYSKKDLLDWLKMLQDMESAQKPKDGGTKVAVQVNNNYNDLMERLFKEGDG